MEYRNLGKSGLQVSALSFGAWLTFGDEDKKSTNAELMRIAYDAGVNFFDNAEAYADGRAETVMGEILKKMGWRRDSYCVSSKVYFGIAERKPTQKGLSRKHVFEACDAALKRLQVDYLDLYFCHRPDPLTPIPETVLAMNDLIRQGKVFYWGTSEWSAEQIEEANEFAREYRLIGPTMEQPQYNLLHRHKVEREFAHIYRKPGLGTTIWSPLASGLLTGKYNDGIPEGSRLDQTEWLKEWLLADWDNKQKKLVEFTNMAKDLGTSPATLAIAWCVKNPNVSTVILGATKTHQLEENLKALDVSKQLDDDLMKRLDGLFPVGEPKPDDDDED